MKELCKGDLIARERRGLLSASERASLPHHLASCASCRLSRQLGADFDATGALRPGDDARVARIAAAVSRRGAPVRRVTVRARWTALLIAAAIGLLAAGAAGAHLWSRRSPDAQIATVALHQPRAQEASPTTAAATAPTAVTEPPPALTEAPQPQESRALPMRAPSLEGTTAASMFAKANDARHNGEVEKAISFYRQLQQKFPATPETQLSRVSLGRLLLERGQASSALEQFDRYLSASGGPLAAEALAGRARALGAQGKQHEERDTWNRLLQEFPGSVYAARARKRLGELE
jgi:TolA-binding protein